MTLKENLTMGSLKYVEGDLLKAIDNINRRTIIAHVCNDQDVWGADFVIPLGQKFPKAKESYHHFCKAWKRVGTIGKVNMVPPISKEPIGGAAPIYVANMIAQTLGGERPLFYNHLSRCMDSVGDIAKVYAEAQIYAPLFGAGLAGGDWKIISELITDCWVRRGINVTVFYLPGQKPECVK